jgi:Protein of unknown function (DUF3107)
VAAALPTAADEVEGSRSMEVRIGVVYTPKELTVEVDNTVDHTVDLINRALTGNEPMLWLTDAKGHRVGVPVDKLAYVEVDADDATKRVGFGRP